LTYATLTNAYNMFDGLNGLALSQFLIALVSIGLFHLALAPTSGFAPHSFSVFVASSVVLFANIGLIGSFLRCFLGDSGARFLGFFLVYVLIMEGNRIVTPLGAVYFVALPLLDMCAVVAARVQAGEGPMLPDRRHLHHLMVDAGVPPYRVVLVMAAISTAFIGLFVLLHTIEASDPVLATILILLAGFYWQNRLRLVGCVRRVFGPLRVVRPGE
jgi:UDP-GlcNAc:undecaprenyl-phosphate GlcNAc-1-phosphate transferase